MAWANGRHPAPLVKHRDTLHKKLRIHKTGHVFTIRSEHLTLLNESVANPKCTTSKRRLSTGIHIPVQFKGIAHKHARCVGQRPQHVIDHGCTINALPWNMRACLFVSLHEAVHFWNIRLLHKHQRAWLAHSPSNSRLPLATNACVCKLHRANQTTTNMQSCGWRTQHKGTPYLPPLIGTLARFALYFKQIAATVLIITTLIWAAHVLPAQCTHQMRVLIAGCKWWSWDLGSLHDDVCWWMAERQHAADDDGCVVAYVMLRMVAP